MSQLMLRAASLALSLLFVTSVLAASGAASGEPSSRVDHPLIEALLARDMKILEDALADVEEFRDLMATPVPEPTLHHLLSGASPAAVLQALADTQPGPLFPILADVWSSGDGAAIAAFLLESHDSATDDFAFLTAHPMLDEFVARLLLARLVVGDMEAAFGEQTDASFESLLATGELPPGWSIGPVSAPATTPVPAPAPTPDTGDTGGAPDGADAEGGLVDGADAPAPEPHPMAGLDDDGDGVAVLAEAESRTFFITSCNLCGASMGAHSGALVASFDLGDIPAELITEASMMIHTFDVDWFVASPCGTPIEKDVVNLNGDAAGHLTGANNQWSTSTFTLDPAWFVDGTNTIRLSVDVLGNGCWRATTAWLQVDVNAETGDVIVDEVETDKEGYNLGDAVKITAKVHTDAEEPDPYPASLAFQLRNPAGDIPAQNTIGISLPADGSQKEFTQTLTIPGTQQVGTPEVGTWTAVVVAFDKDGKVSDRGDKEIGVGTDVSIKKDDVDFEVIDNNPDSGSTIVEFTGTFGWAAAVDEQQPFKATIYVEHGGSVTARFDQDFTIPGKGSGDFTLTAQRVQLDAANDPAVRIVVDSQGAVVEVDEDNNEALIEDFGKPEIVELKSRLKGNFWAGKGLARPNDYTAETKDPEVGKPVEKVEYEIRGPGGVVAEGESTQRGEWKWSHDVGTFDKGRYAVKAVAVTEDGVRSDPKEIEFWNFEPPTLLHSVANALTVPLLDPQSPQDRGDHERYWGQMEVSLSIDLIDQALGPGADLAKAMFTALIGKRLCLNVVKVEIGVDGGWDHEVLSDKSTWKLGIEGGASANVFGKTASFKVKGDGTWTFASGDWRLTGAGLGLSFGIGWQCNVINSLLRLIPPPTGDALAEFNEQFKIGTLLFSFGPNVHFKVALESGMPEILGILPVKEATLGAGATLSITGSISAGGKVSAGVTATGNGVIDLGYTGSPQRVGVTKFGLCDGGCGLDVWAQVSFWWIDVKKTFVSVKIFENGELIWPKSGGGTLAASPGTDGAWHTVETITTGTLPAPTPASFDAGADGVLASGLPAHRTTTAIGAAPDGSLVVVYDVDDGAEPVTGTPGVALATTAGTDGLWRDEGLAVGGPHLDTTADVAVAADGTRVVTWERFRTHLSPTDNPFDHLADNHVFVRATGADGAPGDPLELDPTGGWQFSPRVAVSADGEVIIVSWIEDQDGDIETPDRRAMVGAVVAGNVRPAQQIGPVAGYGDPPHVLVLPTGAAVAAYSHTDGAFAGRAALRVGDPVAGVWSEPVELSAGEQRPDQVRLVADATGLTVAWVETVDTAATIVARTMPRLPAPDDLDASAMTVVTNQTILPLDPADPDMVRELSLVAGPTGVRHYVWHDPGRGIVRTLARDVETADLPPLPPLGAGVALEDSALAALRIPVDVMSGEFAAVDATYRPVADTIAVAASETTTAGAAMRVRIAERALGPDPAVVGIATDPANPAPGSDARVTVSITNTGEGQLAPEELLVTNGGVVVFAGVTPALAPGRTGTVTFDWKVPDVPKPNALVSYVDPYALHDNPVKADDIAKRVVTLPDLAPESLTVDPAGAALELVAVVTNDGVLDAPPTTARFLLPDGSEIGRTTLAAIPAGGAGVASLTTGPAAFVDGVNEVTLVLDTVQDLDSADDALTTLVAVLPDLAVTALDVVNAAEGRPADLRAVVANEGQFPSAPTEVLVELDGGEATRVPLPSLLPGAERTVPFAVPVAPGDHTIRVQVNPDGASRDARVANDAASLVFETVPAPFPHVDEASLVYRPDGVEVRVHNGGAGLLVLEDFALYRGAPKDRPTFGPAYVTKVDNLFAVGGVGGVPGHGSAAAFLPAADVEIRVTSPDVPNSVTRLSDLAPHETVSVRLDPFGTDLEGTLPHMLIEKPLVSITSPTHPRPTEERLSGATTFAFAVVPGRTALGYSYVLDQSPGTIPDTVVDTTAPSLATSLGPGVHWMHVRASFADGWSATDHYPVRIAALDVAPPVTRLVAHTPSLRAGDSSYVGTPETLFSLEAFDDLGVVAGTTVRIDDGPGSAYVAPFAFPVGTHAIEYTSRDPAGNVEVVQRATIEIEPTDDTLRPMTSHAASPVPIEAPGGSFVLPGTTLSLTASDPYEHQLAPPSGVAAVQYTVDGGAKQSYAAPFALPTPAGSHFVEYWSVDGAGNRGETVRWEFQVDDAAPQAAITAPAPDDIVAGPVTFRVEATDAGVGVAGVLLLREGEPLGLASLDEDGTWALEVDTTEWPVGNNAVAALAWDGFGHESEDTIRVYALGRTIEIGPTPQAVVDQHDPHAITDALPGVPG